MQLSNSMASKKISDTSKPIEEEFNICIYIYVYIYRSHNVWVLFLHKIYSEFVAWKLWEALLSEYKDIMKYNGIKAEEVDIRLWCHSHASNHPHLFWKIPLHNNHCIFDICLRSRPKWGLSLKLWVVIYVFFLSPLIQILSASLGNWK